MRLGSRNRRQGDRRNRQMFLKRPGSSLSSRRKIRAINYAQNRASFRSCEILDSTSKRVELIR